MREIQKAFDALEAALASAQPVRLAAVPGINVHVAAPEGSARWSFRGDRRPHFQSGFTEADVLISCDLVGLRGLVADGGGRLDVMGDAGVLERLAEALGRPKSWLEVRSGEI